MRTTNGGQTFIDSMFIDSNLNDIHFKNIFSGNIAAWGRMYRTTNSSANWNPITLPAETEVPFVEKLTFVGDSGWTYSNAGRVYRTTNYGMNWDTISLIPLYGYCIEFADNFTGYAGGNNGRIYKSTNGGFNWFLSLNVGLSSFVSINTFNNSIVWATNGDIYHTINGGLTNIFELKNHINENYYLRQNFPNLFNSTTNIKFDIHKKSNVNLSIYNSLGQLIKVLINKTLNTGSYSYHFDTKGLSSGLYFYKIVGENFKEIKRMVLIK